MQRKYICTILVCLFTIFAFLPLGMNAGAKIDTDSQFMVVNTGVEGSRPIVDDEIIVFSYYHVSDQSMPVYYHNITTRTTVDIGIQGRHIGLDVPYIVIFSQELWLGDLNG
ncbi:MAG: hypothetical protein JSV56_04630, partial [Methanomassiliicoccales archaeon]